MTQASKLTTGIFTNRTDEWSTPIALYKKLNSEFSFKLDAAASSKNKLAKSFFTKKDNALTKDWSKYGSVFCNPPYSRANEFVEKAYNEAKKGCTVVMLIPFRSDTKYYHEYIINKAHEVRLIKGRLKYSDSKQSSPFPSAIIVFKPDNVKQTNFTSFDKEGEQLNGLVGQPKSHDKYVNAIAEDLRNWIKHDKRSTTKLAATFGITDLNNIKELTELAICIVARELAHQPNTTTQQRFNNIVKLYSIQANLSHRTSNSILFQQYSTPAPIGYIMGVFCGIDKGNVHLFEPSAGNGLLTIAGNKRFTIVNELDQVRHDNLLTQEFLKVTQLDASKPFPYLYHKNYPAVITNPPFGRTNDVMFNGVAIGELDHVMALRALDCMEDSGRAAIIIGGHTAYDADGRIQAGKNRKFLTYLYQHYNVLDIIPIDGHKLYSRQGTSFDTRLILIAGRKETPGGFPPLNTNGDVVVDSFDELYSRVMQFVQQSSNNNNVDMKLKLAKAKAKAIKIKLNLSSGELGMPYLPASDACNKLDVDVPDSMGYETHQALDRIKNEIGGDVDEFVRIKLGYATKTDLCRALMAEQIDAVAMAIYNIEQLGQGIIIGDQTGIGKGRQAAAMIRYAHVQGMKPIFITQSANLFSDIYRDLVDIGSARLKPYIVNAKDAETKVKDKNGVVVYEPLDTATQKKIIASAELPTGFDYVMLTYSQISDSEFNKKTGALINLSPKAFFVSKLAQGNILIMDESHNASGDSNTGKVLRDLVEQTKGVVFLSATFAKRADNMPIYALKTSMQEANMTKDALIEAITKGGVALQEVLAAQLVQQGQMLRRERTFEGIEVNYITLTDQEQEHKAISDNITAILRDIISFQTKHVMPVVKELSKIAAKEQGEVELRAGTGKASVDASPYFSKIFNVVNQMLFAIKAESVANHAIQRLREGKKPVIAFSSTMGSFIESLTDDFGMNVDDGTKINADFASVLHNGLQGVLRYTVKDFEGKSTFKSFDITELDSEAQEAYKIIQEKINNAVSGIVISPIDLIKQKIEDAGFTVAEVTGRKYEVQLREAKNNEPMPERKTTSIGIPTDAAKVIPPMQLAAIRPLLKGEEAEFFVRKLSEIDKAAKSLKKRSLEKEARAWEKIKGNTGSYYNEAALPTFRYFNGSTEIYVYEWDEKENAFYTYTILNGDTQNSEFGWQSIDVMFKNYGFGRSFEMDMYHTPVPINEVLEKIDGLGKVTNEPKTVAKKYIGLIRPRKPLTVFAAFNKFNNNEVDVLLINQKGGTGASAHAIVTDKVPASQVKQRVMIILQPELDVNKEMQKRGRINRTGQLIKPIYDYISSAIPAEKRLMMMLQKKLKSLDANTTSNQRNSEDLMKSDDFLNTYGDKVVNEYLLENLELNEALDDVLKIGKSQTDSGKNVGVEPEISSKASGRIAVMDTATQERFYTDVLARYNKYVDMLKAQDEYNLEVETMNLQAKTIESSVVIVGKGGRSPFGDNTMLEKCEVNILKKPYTAIEVSNLLSGTLQDLNPAQYQANLLARLDNHFEAKTKQELADNESYYDIKIANIVKEKKYEAFMLVDPAQAQRYINERTQEFNEARRDKATLISQTNNNQKAALSGWFNYFYPGKMLYYPSDFETENTGNTLAVFLGFEIDENRRNPFAPSAIEARIAIASSKKFIPYPLSRNMELNSIIGASRNINVTKWEVGGRSAWEQAISDNTKDRGIRYILTGNVLQAFGWSGLTKPKLISFTTHDNKVRKGILLAEDWRNKNADGSDNDKYTIVPIGKAKKVVRSMTVGASILSDSGLTVSRLSLDMFRITVSRSVKSGGSVFLDTDLLPLVEGNNFNTVSGVMVANVNLNNIDAVCDILQNKHSISVRLLSWQVDVIKDEITTNQFSDEQPIITQITQAMPNVMVVKTATPNNKLILAKAKAKAIKIKLQLLDM